MKKGEPTEEERFDSLMARVNAIQGLAAGDSPKTDSLEADTLRLGEQPLSQGDDGGDGNED